MKDSINRLHEDIIQNRIEIENNDTQLARRNYLRSIIAFYEIVLSKMRETVINQLIDKYFLSGKLDLHEIYPLMDENVRITVNGSVSFDANRTTLKSMLAYTIKIYAELIDLDVELFSDNRWEAFCKSIQIRHRITHPKYHEDVDITDDELDAIDEGREWWNLTMERLHDAHYQKIISL